MVVMVSTVSVIGGARATCLCLVTVVYLTISARSVTATVLFRCLRSRGENGAEHMLNVSSIVVTWIVV